MLIVMIDLPKVLACAPSNVAVDNLVEKLAKSKAKVYSTILDYA